MYEPLLQRIHGLERAIRRWKLLCGILAAALVAVLACGAVFVGLYGWHGIAAHQEAQRAMEVARQQELLIEQAEVAMEAARALKDAQRQAKKEQAP